MCIVTRKLDSSSTLKFHNFEYGSSDRRRGRIKGIQTLSYTMGKTDIKSKDFIKVWIFDRFFRISSVEIRGRCFCNGHASSCELSDGGDFPQRPVCSCEHNTMGVDCQKCRPNFNRNAWLPADFRYSEANVCEEPKNLGSRSGDIRITEACQCNGHSDRCQAVVDPLLLVILDYCTKLEKAL